MTATPASNIAASTDRVRRRIWVGLVAGAIYVALAAGGGLIFDAILPADTDPVVELALTHLIVLPIAIGGGLVFARFSGWWHDIWTDPRISQARPRRLWMFVVPVALAAQVVVMFIDAPWATLSAQYIFVGLLCYLLVGLGEELYFRGILLEAVRGHHGETVTLLVTALTFGLAHSFASGLSGAPLGGIAFQVIVTSAEGVLFYAALRVTGTLWVPILLHGLGDFGRWLVAGDGKDHTSPADLWLQAIIWVLAIAVLVSTIREDARARKASSEGVRDLTKNGETS